MESVMWNSTNDLSSTDKESGDPVHEIRNPRCGIQSKTGLDSPGPKAFPSRHKGSLQQGKIHLKKFTWRGASVVQCLALFGQNAPINVTRIQDQKICENQEQRPYPSLLRKYVHDKGEKIIRTYTITAVSMFLHFPEHALLKFNGVYCKVRIMTQSTYSCPRSIFLSDKVARTRKTDDPTKTAEYFSKSYCNFSC